MKRLVCGINVRHWILFVSFLAVGSLFANLTLYNLVAVHSDGGLLLPAQFRRVVNASASELNATQETLPERSERVSRDLSSATAAGFDKEPRGPAAVVSRQFSENGGMDAGHPVPSDGPATTRTPTTTKKPSRPAVILTRFTPSTTTTTSSEVEPSRNESSDAISKRSELMPEDKDLVDSDGKEEEAVEKTAVEQVGSSPEPADPTSRNYLRQIRYAAAFASPGLGVLIGHFPARAVMHKFGARITIAAALFLSGIATALMPHCLELGQGVIAVVLFAQGLALAPAFSFIGTSAARWGAVKEQLYFLMISFLALLLAPKISWSVSTLLIEQGQQYAAFLGHATLSLLLIPVWFSFYRDTPQKHRLVNGIELNKICAGKSVSNRVVETNVSSMLSKSVSVWSIWLSAFAYIVALTVVLLFAPIYITSVLGYAADARLGVPFGLMALVHVIAYYLSKSGCCCSATVAARIYNTAALVLCAAAFVGLAVLPNRSEEDNFEERSLWLMLLSLAPLGLACAGFQQSIVNYGRYYAREIISHLSIPFGLALTFVPIAVLLLNHNNSVVLWRLTFIIVAAICLLAAAVFAILGRGEPARWTENSWDPSMTTHKMLNKRLISSENDECGVIEMMPLEEFLNPGGTTTSSGTNGLHRPDSAYRPVDS